MLARKPAPAMSACEALRAAVLRLQQAGVESASQDARILLKEILGVTREQLLADTRLSLTSAQNKEYDAIIARRAARQPVAQLIGRREFWSLTFAVTPDTLDPRPDSETIIEAILARTPDRAAPLRLLDIGTGTGCLLLSLLSELPSATGTAVDVCPKALEVAKGNAESLRLTQRASFVLSPWAKDIEGPFDIIVSNPPYIPTAAIAALAPEVALHEPLLALDGGPDGLDAYRAIIAQLPRLLAPRGFAAFEIGIGQSRELQTLAEQHGLTVIGTKDDLSCITRCVLVAKDEQTTQTIR